MSEPFGQLRVKFAGVGVGLGFALGARDLNRFSCMRESESAIELLIPGM